MSIHHECIRGMVHSYRSLIANHPDEQLLDEINEWPEFNRPIKENNQKYRIWVRLSLQEARNRGLKVKGGIP